MEQGIVKWFNEAKGYGFISCAGKDYFVHYREILQDGFKTLHEGDRVSFMIGNSSKGAVAMQVKKNEETSH